MSQKCKKVAIGIDLGSSKCCVGVVHDGKVEIIENERGNKTTPSYVAFTDTERLIGEDAKDQATLNPTNTVFGVKRIMGRKGDDSVVKTYSVDKQYLVASGDDKRPHLYMTYKNQQLDLMPQQITAMLLTKMKEMGETHLKRPVHDAVISVPACFTNAQRQATKDAAQIAGLNVLRLINEPTAAAIAYEANRRTDAAETVVVVDFGGGKLDVSVVNVGKRKVNVMAAIGTAEFGGNDIDIYLKDYFVSKFRLGQTWESATKIFERTRFACYHLKHSLSVLPKARMAVDSCSDGDDVVLTMTKNEFRSMFQERVQSSLRSCMNTALNHSGVVKEQVSKVLLVGGSTRIPMVHEFLQDFFSKKQVDQTINPDEAVAWGAALQAALLIGDYTLEDVAVTDVVPYGIDIGSENLFRAFAPLPQNKRFPGSELDFSSSYDVYEEIIQREGRSRSCVGNICLSQEFGRATRILLHLLLAIDHDGIFDVTAVLDPTHRFEHIGGNYSESLGNRVLDQLKIKEKHFIADAAAEKKRVAAMADLESFCLSFMSRIDSYKRSANDEQSQMLCKVAKENCNVHLEWVDLNKNAKSFECEKMKKSLQYVVNSFNTTCKQNEKEAKRKKNEEKLLQQQLKQNKNKNGKNNNNNHTAAGKSNCHGNSDRKDDKNKCTSDTGEAAGQRADRGNARSVTAERGADRGNARSVTAERGGDLGNAPSVTAERGADRGNAPSVTAERGADRGNAPSVTAERGGDRGNAPSVTAERGVDRGNARSVTAERDGDRGNARSITAELDHTDNELKRVTRSQSKSGSQQSEKHATEQSTGPATEQSTGPATEQSTGPATEQSTVSATEQYTVPATEQLAELAIEEPMETATEQLNGTDMDCDN